MSNVPVPYYNKSTASVSSFTDYMRDLTEATIASNAMFAEGMQSTLINNQIATERALYNHTQQLDSTLTVGFSGVSRQLGAMNSAMNMGFAFLNSAVQESSKAICAKLDDINETLKSPLLVESRELYNRALKNYNKGLYEEALEDLLEAVKKNKTEPLSYFLMGQTYLRGINEFGNVIDLNASIEALKNAAKYIMSDAKTYPEVQPMAAEIYFYLGLAHYVKANDALHNSNEPDYKNHIEEAKAAYKKSWDYSQNMLESLYNLARCKVLSGEADNAEQDLITVMKKDPGYCVKAGTESDFDKVFLDKLFILLKKELYPQTKMDFDRIESIKATFQGPYSTKLTQLIKTHLPNTVTENTPPFDMLQASILLPDILSLLEKEHKDAEQARRAAEQKRRAEEQERIERERREERKQKVNEYKSRISAGQGFTVVVNDDGMVVAVGKNEKGRCKVAGWRDIVAVAASASHTVGLKKDGTVVAVGDNSNGQCKVAGWRDIVAVAASGVHTVGLKKDGTVVAVGYVDNCNVAGWRGIVAVAAEMYHTVGLKKDGTVVAVGGVGCGECNVAGWRDIVAVAAGYGYTVGLKTDGTVVAVGVGGLQEGQCNVAGWRDIVAVATSTVHTVGLKADGTVVAVGKNNDGQCNVAGWRDIVAVDAGNGHTVGLKADGTVVAVGENKDGQCNVEKLRWKQ